MFQVRNGTDAWLPIWAPKTFLQNGNFFLVFAFFFKSILKLFNFATHLKYSILILPLQHKSWFYDKLFVNKNDLNLQVRFLNSS